jgi:hypothetical protein
MAISTATKNKLNKMNRVAKDATLGTLIQNAQTSITALEIGSLITAGSLTVSTAQAAGSAVTIDTGLGASYLGQIVQVTRSGSVLPVSLAALKLVNTTGSIVITGSGAGVVVIGDKMFWVAF